MDGSAAALLALLGSMGDNRMRIRWRRPSGFADGESENGALAHDAFGPNSAAVHADDAPYDGETGPQLFGAALRAAKQVE